MCSYSQLNIPRALSDFQREPRFKSAWPNFPKVVCLIPVHSSGWFSGLQPWPQSTADYQGLLLRLALSLNNQLRKQMKHRGDTESQFQMSQSATSAVSDRQILEAWSDILSFMSHHRCPSPFSCHHLCGLHTDPLSSSSTPTPSTAAPACQGTPNTTTRFPIWARSLFAEASIWGMCCDCAGLEITDVLFVVWPIQWLAISHKKLYANTAAACEWRVLIIATLTSVMLETIFPHRTLHPPPDALTAPVWHQQLWLDRLHLPLRPLITKMAHKI